jgi:hypothetical protein
MMTETDLVATAGRWMAGDLYEATAGHPLAEVAQRLRRDLLDVQGDGLIPAGVRFGVAAVEESGPGMLCITLAGLPQAGHPGNVAVREVVRTVFELASQYNRVHLAAPYRARFLQYITTLTDRDTVGAVWITTNTVLGDPDPRTAPPADTTPASQGDAPVPAR